MPWICWLMTGSAARRAQGSRQATSSELPAHGCTHTVRNNHSTTRTCRLSSHDEHQLIPGADPSRCSRHNIPAAGYSMARAPCRASLCQPHTCALMSSSKCSKFCVSSSWSTCEECDERLLVSHLDQTHARLHKDGTTGHAHMIVPCLAVHN